MELNVNFIEPTCNANICVNDSAGTRLKLEFNYELSQELSEAIHAANFKGFMVTEIEREHTNGKPVFYVKAPLKNLVQLTQAIAEHTKVVAKDSYSCPTFSEQCGLVASQ